MKVCSTLRVRVAGVPHLLGIAHFSGYFLLNPKIACIPECDLEWSSDVLLQLVHCGACSEAGCLLLHTLLVAVLLPSLIGVQNCPRPRTGPKQMPMTAPTNKHGQWRTHPNIQTAMHRRHHLNGNHVAQTPYLVAMRLPCTAAIAVMLLPCTRVLRTWYVCKSSNSTIPFSEPEFQASVTVARGKSGGT